MQSCGGRRELEVIHPLTLHLVHMSAEETTRKAFKGSEWPTVGAALPQESIVIDDARVRRYLESVNDSTFFEHATAMELHFGYPVAPATILDGEMGSLIFRKRYGLLGDSLHAGQEFQFHRPLQLGFEYEISAQVEDIFERREIQYASVRGWCRRAGALYVTQRYLKALHVPMQRERPASPRSMSIADFVSRHNGRRSARFPSVGAILAGGERVVNAQVSEMFSRMKDPDMPENMHTDRVLARRRGLAEPILKGLLATVSEAQLYREAFGAEWYTRGRLSTKYVRPIHVGVQFEAVGVVVESDDRNIVIESAVAGDGVIVAVGHANVQ